MTALPFPTKLLLYLWSPLSMVPLVLLMSEVRMPQPLPYAWHKALHVLGAVVFLGNIVTQVVWLAGLNRSRHADTIRAAARALASTDLWFMGPGMFLVIANGALLAQAWGGIYRWSWMLAALLVFGLWGIVSGPLMVLQFQQAKLVATAGDEELVAAMSKGSKWLVPLTVLMLAMPVAILLLMVVKPRLW